MHYQTEIEKVLLVRISGGDEAAFLELFHFYARLIRPVVFKITQNEAMVPDLVQDVFLRIWLHREKLPEIDNLRSWIFRIVYHQSFNYLRQQAVRRKAQDRLERSLMDAAPDNPVEDNTLFEETRRQISLAIDHLPPQARRVYLLSREQGLKINEIAATLSISPKTVKNTLTRALAGIKARLEAHGIYLPAVLLAPWLY